MKILIVGGAGYVGGYLVDKFCQFGKDVTVYDNLIYESRYLKNVQFIYGDIRDTEKLKSILHQYDVVIWLAAIVGDGACAIDPVLTKQINEDSVKWLVDNYSGRIIYLSTCSVYGVNDNLIDENAPTNPISVYASTKLAAEQYILNNAKDALAFRLGTLYGLSDTHARIRLDLVVNILTKKATLGEALTVFGGEQWRPLLHVKDVTYAILYGLSNNLCGLYNLSSINYKITDIAKEIQSIIPYTQVSYQEIKFEDQRNYKVRNNKILSTGWLPKYTLKDGILEIHKTISEKRIKDVNDSAYYNVDFLRKFKGNHV